MQYVIHPEFESIATQSLIQRVEQYNIFEEHESKVNRWAVDGDASAIDADTFRRMIRHHDWYADYSDDGSVYRHAMYLEKRYEELIKLQPELAPIYKTAKSLRQSPEVDTFSRPYISPLDRSIICHVDEVDDGVNINGGVVPSVTEWLAMSQFHHGLGMLFEYSEGLVRRTTWYIDGEFAREYMVEDGDLKKPLLTITLPHQIQRQLDVSATTIRDYFKMCCRKGGENDYIQIARHTYSVSYQSSNREGVTFLNLTNTTGKVVFSFLV